MYAHVHAISPAYECVSSSFYILHITRQTESFTKQNHESKVKSNDERQSQSSQIGALVVNGKRFTIQFHFERNQKRTFKSFFFKF